MEFYVTTEYDLQYLSYDLGKSFWNIAVGLAPYDTGNLRRSITLNKNSATWKHIYYNAFNAMYLHYLEMGQGPVKKYKDFIGGNTVGAIIEELIYYIKSGGQITQSSNTPKITLKKTETSAQFYEKAIMRKMKVAGDTITADDRRKMSRIRYGTQSRLQYEREVMRGAMRARVEREYRMSERVFR